MDEELARSEFDGLSPPRADPRLSRDRAMSAAQIFRNARAEEERVQEAERQKREETDLIHLDQIAVSAFAFSRAVGAVVNLVPGFWCGGRLSRRSSKLLSPSQRASPRPIHDPGLVLCSKVP